MGSDLSQGHGRVGEPGTRVTTEFGKSLTEKEIEPLRKGYLAALAETRKKKAKAAREAGADLELAGDGADDEPRIGEKSFSRCC